MKNRIDQLLMDIINSGESPSDCLSDKTKQLFLNINTNTPEFPNKKGLLSNPKTWTSFIATSAVFLLCTMMYMLNPGVFSVPGKGASDISPSVQGVQNITTPKPGTSYATSDPKNSNGYDDSEHASNVNSKHKAEMYLNISLDNSSTSEYFKPGESIKFKISISALGSDVKFATDPVIRIFRSGDTLPEKAVCEYPVEGFAGTTLYKNQSREVYRVISIPVQPDWYYTVLEVKIFGESNRISTYSTYNKNFMVEYPENGTHSSSLKIGKTIVVDKYEVTLERISMNATQSCVNYTKDSKISDCEIYIFTDSGRSISPLDLTQDGKAVYAPVPKDVHKLIFEIRRLSVILAGTKGQGEFKDLNGSWKAEVNLD